MDTYPNVNAYSIIAVSNRAEFSSVIVHTVGPNTAPEMYRLRIPIIFFAGQP